MIFIISHLAGVLMLYYCINQLYKNQKIMIMAEANIE